MMKSRLSLTIIILSIGSGCAGLSGPVQPSSYAKLSCVELDNAIEKNAKAITQLAIDRGTAARLSIPNWLLGVSATVDAVNERRSSQISALQDQQAALKVARDRAC